MLGLLLPLGAVSARAMFGGWGLYHEGTMFGLIEGERLYFKVDPESESDFLDKGCAAFTYRREGRRVALSYREAPAGALASPEALRPWAERGLEAARRRAAAARIRTNKGRPRGLPANKRQ